MNGPPTEKQRAARTRNFGIFNLRSLYALSWQIRGPRGETIRALIDAELMDRGALPTVAHHAAASVKRVKQYQKLIDKGFVQETDIPF
jgi:hypothetical protein